MTFQVPAYPVTLTTHLPIFTSSRSPNLESTLRISSTMKCEAFFKPVFNNFINFFGIYGF